MLNSDINEYEQIIHEQDYYSFPNGHTYFIGDTIFISKYSQNRDLSFEIRDVLTGNTINEKTFEMIDDLSIHKFNENYKGKITDFFIAKESGIFLFILKSKNQNLYHDIVFINRNDSNCKINIVLSDYTWNCYNSFGGRSNYRDEITPYIVKEINKLRKIDNRKLFKLGQFRPYISNNEEIMNYIEDNYEIIGSRNYNCVISELPLIKLLFENYYNDFKIIDCNEFEYNLQNFKDGLIIFNGHTEYWSASMIEKLKILKEDKNILFFSGNNIFKEIESTNDYLMVNSSTIPRENTTKLIGTYFNGKEYLKNSSFIIKKPDNFLFSGINSLEFGDDWAASIEFDKTNNFTDSSCEVIATGKSVGCDIVLMTNNNKKYLLNTSSVGSFNGLKEANFKKFIMNFIDLSVNAHSF